MLVDIAGCFILIQSLGGLAHVRRTWQKAVLEMDPFALLVPVPVRGHHKMLRMKPEGVGRREG